LVTALAGLATLSAAQLRVVTHNISNYAGGRTADLQKIYFDSFGGRAMRPDVILGQEFQSQAAVNSFLSMLNTATNSTKNWAAAPFTDGPDTDSAMFYRTDKVQFVAANIISAGGSNPNPPRNTMRYDIRLRGYSVLQPKVALYCVHFKAGNTATDEARRLVEAGRIRTNAQTLDSSFWGFLIGGDMNVYTSTDDGYQKLIGSETNNLGRFFDPISRPGSWDGSATFKFIHSQDPFNSMNSRFDIILLSSNLVNSLGMDYIGAYGTQYGVGTWDSATHSYRIWGNDGGQNVGSPLRVTGNTMVGPDIAQSLRTVATSAGGHLPVFLDLYAPAELQATTTSVDFGKVIRGSNPSRNLTFKANYDTVLWSAAGVSNLPWKAAASSLFSVGTDAGTLTPGQSTNIAVGVNTATVGTINGSATVTPDDAQGNPVTIPLTAQVVPDVFVPPTFGEWGFSNPSTSGGFAQYANSDDQRFNLNVPRSFDWNNRFPSLLFTGAAPVTTVGTMALRLEMNASQAGRAVSVYARDRVGMLQFLGTVTPTLTDSVFNLPITNPNQFIDPANGQVQIVLTAGATAPGPAWTLRIDQLAFVITG
jgi:hypothetical protein